MDEKTIEFGFKERVLQFYFLNRKKVYLYTGATIFSVAALIVFCSLTPNDMEYHRAIETFEKWKLNPHDLNLEKEMKHAVEKVPGRWRSMEAKIAQVYLGAGMVEKAEPIARACLLRLSEESPDHAAFAKASLLIEKEQYQKALEASVALKEEMEKALDSQLWKGSRLEGKSVLYACNLLRIAVLQKQLRNSPGELAAWEEVKGLIEVGGESSAAAQFLQANFGRKQFSLSDFISQREKSIVVN
jgi:tetratricopeptide (TPR) repeat protein